MANRLLLAEGVKGKCYVITFSKYHNRTLADLTPPEILPVIDTWTRIYGSHLSPESPLAKLAGATTLLPKAPGTDPAAPNQQLRWMQIFENKGSAMGCSNPHPHGQIWTSTGLPDEPASELVNMSKYRRQQGGAHLLVDYANLEADKKERVVFENTSFLVVCPWWAVWPYEVMIISKEHRRALVDFNEKERLDLAEAIGEVTRRYDNVFETHFPYSKPCIHCSIFHITDSLRHGYTSGTP